MKKIFTVLFLLLLFTGCSFAFQISQGDARADRIVQKLRLKLEELQKTAKFPGATAAFVLPDGGSAAVAVGLGDKEKNIPLVSSDAMPAGSIGKTFVAAEALLLAQEGKINLDEKIGRWLGSEPWFAQLPNAKDITLRMLLNHSSGIPNHVDDRAFVKALFKDAKKDIRYEELIAYVTNKKPLFPAGQGHHYADTNYILIGMIVEKATGDSLYGEIERLILKPLKLDRTFPSNNRKLPGVVNGYFQNKPVIVNGEFLVNPQWEWAGGGFASNAEDLARWAAIIYSGGFLRKEYFDEMLKGIKTDEGPEYGLGVEIIKSRWGKAYGHDGEFPGYLSDMRYFPDYKFALAVQMNADETPEMERVSGTVIDELAQAVISELFEQTFSAGQKTELQKIAEDWLKLIETGRYAESWDGAAESFKTNITKEKWLSRLPAVGKKLGRLKSRTFKDLTYAKPNDELIVVKFESSYAKFPAATEILTLKLEKDGKWRVLSYSIG